jgi:uncharacterized protein (DUF2267 family)
LAQGLAAINQGIELTQRWIDALMDEADWQDREKAYIALRAVLLTVRDRLNLEDAVSLGGALPMVLRGVFFEGWEPHPPKRVSTRREFLRAVTARLDAAGEREDPEVLTRAVFRVLAKHLPAYQAA